MAPEITDRKLGPIFGPTQQKVTLLVTDVLSIDCAADNSRHKIFCVQHLKHNGSRAILDTSVSGRPELIPDLGRQSARR